MVKSKVIVLVCCLLGLASAQEVLQGSQKGNAVKDFKNSIQYLAAIGGPNMSITSIGDIKEVTVKRGSKYVIIASYREGLAPEKTCVFELYRFTSDDADMLKVSCRNKQPKSFPVRKLQPPQVV